MSDALIQDERDFGFGTSLRQYPRRRIESDHSTGAPESRVWYCPLKRFIPAMHHLLRITIAPQLQQGHNFAQRTHPKFLRRQTDNPSIRQRPTTWPRQGLPQTVSPAARAESQTGVKRQQGISSMQLHRETGGVLRAGVGEQDLERTNQKVER